MTKHTIKGTYYNAGYIDDLAPRALDVEVIAGRLWLRERGYDTSKSREMGDPPLSFDADGDIEIAGNRTFAPAQGELSRIGAAA